MRRPLSVIAAVLVGMLAPTLARATTITLDTSLLVSSGAGPFYLDFQLVDGDGVANNHVTLSGFTFGAGSAVGTPMTTGSVSGDTSSGATLSDASFFNELIQQFVPGDLLSFSFDVTTNLASVTPDRFTFAILDSSLFELPTFGAGNELIGVNLRNPLVIEAYAGFADGVNPTLPSPQVDEVPEPGTLILLATGIVAIVGRRRARPGR